MQLRETSHRVKSTLTLKHKTSFSPVWTECVFIAWSSSLPQKNGRLLPHPGGASSLSSNRWRSASSRSWTLPLRDDASKGGAPTWAGAGTPEGSRGDVNARRRSTKNPELQSVWELCSCRGETSRTRKHFQNFMLSQKSVKFEQCVESDLTDVLCPSEKHLWEQTSVKRGSTGRKPLTVLCPRLMMRFLPLLEIRPWMCRL